MRINQKKYENGIEYGTKEEPKKNQQTPTHSIKPKREYEQRHKFFLTICKKVYSVWDTHKTNSTSKLWITHTMRKKYEKVNR